MSKITSPMTPKQYQRELREILSNLANYTYNAGVAAKNYGIMISGEPTKDALQAILDLNERALPEEKSTYIEKGVWQPIITDEIMKMGFNSAISDIRQIIGKGK